MKKKIFFALGFLILLTMAPPLLWAAPDVFQHYTQYFSYEDKTFITGEKLELSFIEGSFSTDFNNCNYSVSLFSEKYFNHFPCKAEAGNILIGGLLSRLKDPLLDSGVDGFTTYYTQPAVITSQLPSFTTFSKPFSTFIQLSYDDDKRFPLQNVTINGAYTPSTKDMSYSASADFNINEIIIIKGASGISFFTMKENKPTSWYSDLPYYKEQKSISIGNQLAIQLFDIFQSDFSIFLYKTPDCKIGEIYKLENKAEWNNFITSLCIFCNCNKFLITPHNKVLEPVVQIKSNFQYFYDFAKKDKKLEDESILKSGITLYSKIPLTPPISPDLKFGIATTFSNSLTTINNQNSFSFKLHYIEDSCSQIIFTYFSSKLESIWKVGFFEPALSLSSRLYFSSAPKGQDFFPLPELNTQNYSIKLSTCFFGDLIEGSSTYSFSVENHNIYNKKLKMGLTFNGTFKKIIIILKINGDFCI